MDARLALGAGEQPSINRDRHERPGTQGGVIFSGRPHRGTCLREPVRLVRHYI